MTKRLGLSKETYANYEKDKTKPVISHWPKIIVFLGFDPSPAPTSDGERLLAYRRQYGLSRAKLARELGVDEGTLHGWEAGRGLIRRQNLSKSGLLQTILQ
jgi:transcriptional regulator with XRE-family HTH domain